jgi:hypothetical protein
MKRPRLVTVAILVGLACSALANPSPLAAQTKPVDESRKSVVGRSKVWIPTTIRSMNLRTGPTGAGSFKPGATVTCRYFEKDMSGRSPKFACRLPNGDELKVKYGSGEVYAEVAATRLLWALGFGADHMYSVRVVCQGCPDDIGIVERGNGDRVVDPATIERKMPGRELFEEWKWEELDDIAESAGGARKAERDALKLLAVLLQHNDNKPQQQRLICANSAKGQKGRCRVPMMMINDLGVTFGHADLFNAQPRASANLEEWAKVPIWKENEEEPRACVGNLSGSFTGTLKDPVIGEEGRRLLARLLTQLSDRQLRDMFDAARVHLRPRSPESGRSGFATTAEWVQAFKQKRTQIVERRCAA